MKKNNEILEYQDKCVNGLLSCVLEKFQEVNLDSNSVVVPNFEKNLQKVHNFILNWSNKDLE